MSEPVFKQFLKNHVELKRKTRILSLQRTHQSRIEAAENRWAELRLRASIELDALSDPASDPMMPNDERLSLQVCLPTGPLVTVAADSDRRTAFRTHLDQLLDEVFNRPNIISTEDQADEVSPGRQAAHPVDDQDGRGPEPVGSDLYGSLSGQLCGVCAGGCCPSGSNHAFVTVETIRRVQSQVQYRSAEEMQAKYLSFLPEFSQEGGCIYQRADGCALPRGLRGDTCNSYVCDSFRAVQEAEEESRRGTRLPLQAVIVVQRRQNQWLRDKPALDNSFTGLAVLTPAGEVLRFTPDELEMKRQMTGDY